MNVTPPCRPIYGIFCSHCDDLELCCDTISSRGVPKAEIARRVGVSRRTVYHGIETGQLDRELDAEPVRYGPRRRAPSKLGPNNAIIDDRLATYTKLSATRLYREVRESGYEGSYSQVKRYVRGVRPGAESAPERRFEDAAGPSGSGGLRRLRASGRSATVVPVAAQQAVPEPGGPVVAVERRSLAEYAKIAEAVS